MHTYLFDLDGTLTEPFVGITKSIQYALEGLGYDVPPADDLRFAIGPPLEDSFSLLMKTQDPALLAEAVRLYRERYRVEGLYENYLYDGIPAVLEQLKNTGAQLFVCTSKLRPVAEIVIEHFGLSGFFSKVYGAEADGTFNNKVDLLAHLVKLEGLRVSDVVMIGDRMYDMNAARQNGAIGIGVLWGHGSQDELMAHGALAVVHTPDELAAKLAELMQEAA